MKKLFLLLFSLSCFGAEFSGVFVPPPSTSGNVMVSDGAKWTSQPTPGTGTVPANRGGTGITSYTAGDILYATGASTLAKLPIGSNGQVLTLSGGLPVWTTPSSGATGFIAAIDINCTTSAAWTTSSTSFVDVSGPTGCTFTKSGSALDPSTTYPGLQLASMDSGEYLILIHGYIAQQNATAFGALFRISNGTDTGTSINQIAAPANLSVGSLSFRLNVASTRTNAIVRVQMAVANAAAQAYISAGSTPSFQMEIYKM